MVPQAGKFMGSAEGPVMFMAAFQKSVENWMSSSSGSFSPIVLVDPCDGEETTREFSTFADDTFAAITVPDGSPANAAGLLRTDDVNAAMLERWWVQKQAN